MEPRKAPNFAWMYLIVLALAAGLAAWGIVMAANGGDRLVMAAGCLGVIGSLLALAASLDRSAHCRASLDRVAEHFNPINERLQHMSMLLNQVSEQQLLSERTKAVAFRDKEREAVRLAIREEMSKREWEGALKLVDEIEAVFGYKQEAERFREEIFQQRDSEVRKVVGEGLAIVDRHCREEKWTQALREAERLLQLFPKDAQVSRVPQDIENRRQAHKKQLVDSWNDAVTRHDVDGSIEILRKLDLYLTPQEALGFQDMARQVFKDKLLLMGQQFTLTVKDHKWAEALKVGDNIVREFPNSRMATEVKEKMDLLRQKAAETEPASV